MDISNEHSFIRHFQSFKPMVFQHIHMNICSNTIHHIFPAKSSGGKKSSTTLHKNKLVWNSSKFCYTCEQVPSSSYRSQRNMYGLKQQQNQRLAVNCTLWLWHIGKSGLKSQKKPYNCNNSAMTTCPQEKYSDNRFHWNFSVIKQLWTNPKVN